ncbi:uncharacterized protein N7483_012895 [Penicillium malachiteum]|uniref:uncharacterized protein n=1 Tax=Penicillium malachiteum TaxID=1324776 RepID=UPI002547354A|nr:uncharacterized protein N7483_012895 [Penicillium malachiteum]KAJ5715714.1 hypothetical protein N7483_012895 [Penicillium malachiteum]
MAATYDVQTYLLDRANIRHYRSDDAPIQFDTGATTETINSVYTTEIHLDYDQLLGFSPEVISSEAWAKRWIKFISRLKKRNMSSSEAQTPSPGKKKTMTPVKNRNILIDLPQPTGNNLTTRPDRCHVSAYAHGWFYNRDANKFPRLMARRQGTQGVGRERRKSLENKQAVGEAVMAGYSYALLVTWETAQVTGPPSTHPPEFRPQPRLLRNPHINEVPSQVTTQDAETKSEKENPQF